MYWKKEENSAFKMLKSTYGEILMGENLPAAFRTLEITQGYPEVQKGVS